MSNLASNQSQQNFATVNTGQQGSNNKINKQTSQQIKNIFSRDVIKNPLKIAQVGSDEQKAMQSTKSTLPIQKQPEPGEINQSINTQLSYNRPVTPPQMPNLNQHLPNTSSSFTNNTAFSNNLGSTNISPNIAIQQTVKNDFKLTVGESNKPITSPIQNNNIFNKSNPMNPPPPNIPSSQQNPLINKSDSSISPGLNTTNQNQINQNAGRNALASINKIQQQKQSIIPVNSNENMNLLTGETVNMTLQTLFKHAKFDENQLSLQVNPCNIRNTKLILLNQANKLMSGPTLNLSKLKLSSKPLKDSIDPDQIYYMLYQFTQCKQQLSKIQKLTKIFEQNDHTMIDKLKKKLKELNDISINIFFYECYISKIGERYNRIQKQINTILIPLIQSNNREYSACSLDQCEFDQYVANYIKDSFSNLENGTKQICTQINLVIKTIEEIEEKNGKQALQIISRLQDCFNVIKSDLEQLSQTKNNRKTPTKNPQSPVFINHTKKCNQLIQTAALFLNEIDQILIKASQLHQKPQINN